MIQTWCLLHINSVIYCFVEPFSAINPVQYILINGSVGSSCYHIPDYCHYTGVINVFVISL